MDVRASTSLQTEHSCWNLNNVYSDPDNIEFYIDAIVSGMFSNLFQSFGSTLDTLFFEGNILAALSEEHILQFSLSFNGTKIRKLYLGNNILGLLTENKIKNLFSGFSNLDELYLNNNELSGIGTTNFILLLNCIKATRIKRLDLNTNGLYLLGTSALLALKNTIENSSLEEVNLHNNGYDNFLPHKIYANMLNKLSLNHSLENVNLDKIRALSIINASYAEKFFPNKHVEAFDDEEVSTCFTPLFTMVKHCYNELYAYCLLQIMKYQISRLDVSNTVQVEYPLKVASTFHDIKSLLAAKKTLTRQKDISLKNLCIHSIFANKVSITTTNLPEDLKQEIENTNCGLIL